MKKQNQVIFSIICLLLFLSFSFFGHYSRDDFYLVQKLRESSIWQFAYDAYFNWDGRSFSIAGLFQLFLLKYVSPQLIFLIWSIFFLGAVFLVLKISTRKHNNQASSVGWLHFVLLVLIFWLGNYANLMDTLYWCTGGAYTLSIFLTMLWIFVFNISMESNVQISTLKASLFYLYSFLIAQASAQMALIILVNVSIYFPKIKKEKFIWRGIILILLILGGGLITVFAPGNMHRITVTPQGLNTSLLSLFENSVKIYAKFFFYGVLLFLLSWIWAVWVFGKSWNPLLVIKHILQTAITIRPIPQWFIEHKWLIMAVVSVFPILVLPDFAGPRPSVLFLWLNALFVIDKTRKSCSNKI